MVAELEEDFCLAAMELADGTATDPRGTWNSVDTVHYDINSCFREGIVLLKSFLLALPEEQLISFQDSVCEQSQPHEAEVPGRQIVIRHRRMASIAGE
jgi:hypothetical protein